MPPWRSPSGGGGVVGTKLDGPAAATHEWAGSETSPAGFTEVDRVRRAANKKVMRATSTASRVDKKKSKTSRAAKKASNAHAEKAKALVVSGASATAKSKKKQLPLAAEVGAEAAAEAAAEDEVSLVDSDSATESESEAGLRFPTWMRKLGNFAIHPDTVVTAGVLGAIGGVNHFIGW